MPKKEYAPFSLYESGREYLKEQEKKNEILAEIAGVSYEPPGDIPSGKYVIEKRMLDAAQKENELLEDIAEVGGSGGGANKLAIDYATDVVSLKKNDTAIADSGVTLPAYGLNYNSSTGGLTLTKNGTAVQGQTVALPPYGTPLTASSTAGMTDTDKVYVYTGETTASLTNGHWYYYDGDSWEDGGTYNSAGINTDTTLLLSGVAADAKATGEADAVSYRHIGAVENNLFTKTYTGVTVPVTLTMGGFYADTGLNYNSSSGKYYRTTSNPLIPIGSKDLLIVMGLSGFEWSCYSYTGTSWSNASHSNTFSKYIPATQPIYVPANETDKRLCITVRKADQSAFSSAEVTQVQNAIKFYNTGIIQVDYDLATDGAAADAMKVGKFRDATDAILYYLTINYGNLIHDSGISGSSHTEGTSSDDRFCRTKFYPMSGSYRVTCNDSDNTYRWRIQSYSGNAWSDYSHEYTNNGYVPANRPVYVSELSSSDKYFVVSFRRNDWASLTDADYTAIAGALKITAAGSPSPQNFQSVQNSPAAVKHMTDIAETYLGRDDMWYGSANVAYSQRVTKCRHGEAAEDESGKFNIDCSTFATLCLRGTPFEKSRYTTGTSGENTVTGGFIFDDDSPWYSFRTYGGGEMLANKMAWYAYQHGYLYKISHRTLGEPAIPNIMCNDIRPGDFIFRSNASSSRGYWMDIGHIMMVADVDENYIYCYEAIDNSAGGDYYSPCYTRRTYTWLQNNYAYFGARFPLAERGTMPKYCNIVPVVEADIASVIPEGASPAPTISVSGGTVTVTGSYTAGEDDDPIVICVPFTAPGDAVCSFGVKETGIDGIAVSVWKMSGTTAVKKAYSPDGFSASNSDALCGKCKLENGTTYALTVSISQLTDSVSFTPYVVKGVTFDGYHPYVGDSYELEDNMASLLARVATLED